MKQRLKIIALVFAAVVVGIAAWVFCQPAEPTYKGRTLTSYLRGPWEQIDGPQTDNPHYAPNEVAIRAIGTNGIPTLLRLIKAHDPSWKAKAIAWLNSQRLVHINILDAGERRGLGLLGFCILGDLAKPAAPELVKLVQAKDLEVSEIAAGLLLNLDAGLDAHIAALRGIRSDSYGYRNQALIVGGKSWRSIFEKRFPEEAANQTVRGLMTALTDESARQGAPNSQTTK